MGGILKNPLSKDEVKKAEDESLSAFRQTVYKNTQLNAKLTSRKDNNCGELNKKPYFGGDRIPKDTLMMKREHDLAEEERLQWNQRNLAENEITKKQFQDIHVDEPKTPYQGAVDPAGEYYKVDDEDAIPGLDDEGLDDFTLGEAVYEVKPGTTKQEQEVFDLDTGDVRVQKPEHNVEFSDDDQKENNNDGGEEEDLDDDARKKKFEEMRKKHYNLKEVFKNRSLHANDDDDDAEQEDNDIEE